MLNIFNNNKQVIYRKGEKYGYIIDKDYITMISHNYIINKNKKINMRQVYNVFCNFYNDIYFDTFYRFDMNILLFDNVYFDNITLKLIIIFKKEINNTFYLKGITFCLENIINKTSTVKLISMNDYNFNKYHLINIEEKTYENRDISKFLIDLSIFNNFKEKNKTLIQLKGISQFIPEVKKTLENRTNPLQIHFFEGGDCIEIVDYWKYNNWIDLIFDQYPLPKTGYDPLSTFRNYKDDIVIMVDQKNEDQFIVSYDTIEQAQLLALNKSNDVIFILIFKPE